MKKNKKIVRMTAAFFSMVCILSAFGLRYFDQTAMAAQDDYSGSSNEDEEEITQIKLSEDETVIVGEGASAADKTVTISEGGTYLISGSLENGQIYINAKKSDSVTLKLSGIDISNESEPAIFVKKAGSTVLYLMEGTENLIKSGTDNAYTDTDEPDDEKRADPDASEDDQDEDAKGGAVYSHGDLVITGCGTLEVTGLINNGIQTADNLSIENGIVRVYAVNDGIKGKDSVTISGGTVMVSSEGDGISAKTVFEMSDGEIQIVSGDGSDGAGNISFNSRDRGGFYGMWDMGTEDTVSTKGIKCGTAMKISGGTISIDSYDDALHSDGTVDISGGDISISAGDDGIHADTELSVSGGTINIEISYEGMEANHVFIEGGDISITSYDDGINAYGGANNFGMGRYGGNFTDTSDNETETPWLLITGGNIWINAYGDGMDSNGDLTVEGGTIIVDGPSDSMNGAIDSGTENGGICSISGGTVLAIGSSGMAETFGSTSAQYSFLLRFSGTIDAGSRIVIADENGNILMEHTAAKSFASVVFSDPSLKEGMTYQITINDYTVTLTLNSVSGIYSTQFSEGRMR